jgi:hypothetical protein
VTGLMRVAVLSGYVRVSRGQDIREHDPPHRCGPTVIGGLQRTRSVRRSWRKWSRVTGLMKAANGAPSWLKAQSRTAPLAVPHTVTAALPSCTTCATHQDQGMRI